ncbi:structural maintenance of chromosomes 5 smc5 [Ophiocordyceps sinensis CO18]|nr:structural maintenance of chromosomes 5 smc5 [Ophiocordyceps sinensis CO18]
MARSSSRRRRRAESDDQEASDGPRSQASSDSPKRRRLHLEPDDESVDEASRPDAASHVSMDDFHPGAILRVKVENFVTYEQAEFFPGPHLNMVIGPNGTGKSSLVCAICLGLGYSPKHLGRAGSVKEFVKHGKDTATIEIELQKRPNDRSNHVVRVQIRREQNSQKWWLNGKETSQKAIQRLMHSLKIQVDNLCQFLPQDRVVEFAACTPIDLLHETLRAAAPEAMLQWQKQLQDLHKDKKDLAQTVHADVDILRNLESRQQGLQADVDRIREREEIQQRVQNLRSALVLARYQEARNKHSGARDRKKEAERALRRLEEECGPSLEAVNLKTEYAGNIETAILRREQALKDAEQATSTTARHVSTAVEDVKDMGDRIDAERKGFEAKKKELATSRSKITMFQADLKNRPADFNAAEWNQKIRAEEHTLRELEIERRQLSTEITSVKDKGRAVIQQISRVEAEVEALDTQQGQQLNLLRKHFPDVATGWDWVQEHQGDFEKEVFGPPMISCSMKDERYSDQVQALLQNDDFVCFTAQTKNDYKRLTDQLYRVLSLSVTIRTCSHSLEAFQPPVSRAEASTLGLDGFAVDYLEGPALVLAMLCAEKRLHQSGVSLSDHNDAEYESLVNNGRVSQWVAGQHSYAVRRRREYGPQAMTTISKSIRPGRFWTSQPIDSQEKMELNRRLTELKGEKDLRAGELRELKAKLPNIEEQATDVTEKIDALKSDKSTLQREYQKWQALPAKIESEERVKATHEHALRDSRKTVLDLHYQWDNAALKRVELVLKHKKLIDQLRDAHCALLEARIQHIEARSDIEGLKNRNASLTARLEQERQNLQKASDEAGRAKEDGRRLSEQVRDLLAQNADKRDLWTQLSDGKTPEELDMDMTAEEAKLELIHAANPNVIREFERRAQEIGRLRSKMEGFNEKLEGLDRQRAEIMGKWEPKLDELVSKINDAFAYNFEQISCAGEVRVHKDDDFDLWALDIMVKFR